MGQFKQVINAVGTTAWIAPTGVTSVDVELWGSGGGSGPGAATFGGGGGGGGQYVKSTVTVTPGNSYNVFVADGGNPQANGAASTFNSTTVVADFGRLGGAGGAAAGGAGGAGGTGGTGTTKRNGGAGATGALTTGGGGGGSGGDTTAGGAGSGQTGGAAGTTNGATGGAGGGALADGSLGVAPGSGAGGGGTTGNGRKGGAGKAILTWTGPAGVSTDTVTPTDLATKTTTFIRNLGPKVLDFSGNGRHGTLTDYDRVQLVNSPFSSHARAVQFDASVGSSINAGATGTGVSSSFTFEYRVRFQNVNSGDQLMGRYDSSSANQNFQVGIDNTASWIANMRRDTGGQVSLSAGGGNNAVAGVNYHIAIVYSLANTRFYMFKDGVEVASTGSVNGVQAPDGITPLFIGRVANSGAPASMKAIIDEVRLSDIARYTTGFTPGGPFTADANTLLLYHLDGFTDLVTPTDLATTAVGYGRILGDTTTPTDQIVKNIRLNKADTATSSDATPVKIIGVKKADSTTPTDVATKTVAYKRSFTDTTTPTDAIKKNVTKVFADSISGSTPAPTGTVIFAVLD